MCAPQPKQNKTKQKLRIKTLSLLNFMQLSSLRSRFLFCYSVILLIFERFVHSHHQSKKKKKAKAGENIAAEFLLI